MTYNFKRALGISLVLYLATGIVGVICGVISGKDMSNMGNIPDSYWYMGMVAAVILTWLFTHWYFKNRNINPSAKSGFMFGLTAVVVASVIDYVVFSFAPESAQIDLGEYYGDYRYWIIIVLVIVTAKLVGHMKKPKTMTPPPAPQM